MGATGEIQKPAAEKPVNGKKPKAAPKENKPKTASHPPYFEVSIFHSSTNFNF